VTFAAKRYAAKLEMDAERKSGGKLPQHGGVGDMIWASLLPVSL
jgi:hypothetical protein